MSEPESGDCIKIFVRVRPSSAEQRVCLNVTSEREIVLSSQPNPKTFEFDHVADQSTTQEDVFKKVGEQIVESCVEGYNGTIFAYGQTGSGKTHTMLGPGEENGGDFDHHLRGIIPRSLEYLFELIQRKQQMHGKQFNFTCKASFLEIYNEQVFDLLDPCATKPLQLRECKDRGVFVEGLSENFAANGCEAYNVLSSGWCNRRVASTSMNRESSRSHAVFTLTVETREQTASITKVRQSVLNFVDLAGSERQKDTQVSGVQLREAGKINGSLSVLGQVIMALDDVAHQKTRHVPYRNSKLTFLLRDSLGGNAKTFIVINVHPNAQYFGETTSTLQFAQRAKQIKNKARVNENTQGDYIQLQGELKRLKSIIQRFEYSEKRNTLMSTSYEGYDEVRLKFINTLQMLQKQQKVIATMKNQIAKMEKFNMSRNFVIKLRDSKIADLKRGKATNRDEAIDELKKELEAVKEQVLHHPEIAAYQTKIQELQNVVEDFRLTTPRTADFKTQEKEFDELYARLLNEIESEKEKDSIFNVTESSVSTPTIDEKQKERINELETTLKTVNEEVATIKSSNSTLETELKSARVHIQELEQILEVTRANSTFQQKRRDKLHETTLRSITTPIKRDLRRSESHCPSPSKMARVNPIPFGLSQSPNSLFDDDFASVPMLMDQRMPDDMEEVLQEALQEELKQVKEDMEKYREESLTKDCEIASLRQTDATSREQLATCTQSLTKLQEQVYKFEMDCATQKSEHEIAKLEVRDLRILLKSSDKEFAEARKIFESTKADLNKKIEDLKAVQFKLQVSYSKLESDKESVINEVKTLGVDVENQKMEIEFVKQQLVEESKLLEAEKFKRKEQETELKNTYELLENEMMNCATLQDQLEGKTKETSEELSELRNSNFKLTKELQTSQEEYKCLNERLEISNKELDNVKKRRQEDGGAIQALRTQVSEMKGAYSMMEIANTGLHAEIDEIMEEIKKSAGNLEVEQNKREGLEKMLTKERNEFQTEVSKRTFEMESLQEDIVCWEDQYSALQAKLKNAETELENSGKKVDILQHELKEKSEKLREQHILLEKTEEAERLRSSTQEEYARLAKDFRQQTDEVDQLNKQIGDVSNKYLECRNRESEYEARLKESEKLNANLSEEHKNEIETMRSKIEEKHRQINSESLDQLQAQFDSACTREKQAAKFSTMLCDQINQLEIQLEESKHELENIKKNDDIKNEEINKLKNLEESFSLQLQSVESELRAMNGLKAHLEEENKKMAEEKENLLSENATLAGHSNRKQKIHYVIKLKQKILDLEEENHKLGIEMQRVSTTIKTYEPEFKLKNYHLNPGNNYSLPLTPKNENRK